MEPLLLALMSPDNAVRRDAEARFAALRAQPDQLITGMMQTLTTSQLPHVSPFGFAHDLATAKAMPVSWTALFFSQLAPCASWVMF
jgi:hypothetical protein